jgi:uncharacterized C2H2 Zn-finger protein
MARARREASPKTNDSPTSDSTLTCPECGKTFTRPASLGAHRSRAHGVAGASTRAQRTRNRRSSHNGGTAHRTNSAQATRRQATRRSNTNASRRAQTNSIDRDALLQALFPNGLPAREAVIRRANAWLDEAEQLAHSH